MDGKETKDYVSPKGSDFDQPRMATMNDVFNEWASTRKIAIGPLCELPDNRGISKFCWSQIGREVRMAYIEVDFIQQKVGIQRINGFIHNHHRPAVLELFKLINERLDAGAFVLDMDSGEHEFIYDLPLQERWITFSLLDRLDAASKGACKKFGPAIIQVTKKRKTPAQAFSNVLGLDVPPLSQI